MEIGKIKEKNKYLAITDSRIKFDGLFLDNFTKLAILTILAGYHKSDNIIINDYFSKKVKIRNLNSFISYILNHKIAPKKFRMMIKQNTTALQSFQSRTGFNSKFKKVETVLNFSGGLDSTAGLLYALDKGEKVLPLWIDFGQRNNLAEYKSIKKISHRLKIKPLILSVNLKKDILAGWKDWDFIIPGRNFLFLSLANSILRFSKASEKNVYLCAHKDEMGFMKNRDKSNHFFKETSFLFSAVSGQKIKCLSPFRNYSKSEIISYWRRKWEKKYKLSPLETTTCYYSDNCGKCDACLKRAIYLLAGGYDISQSVKTNPLEDQGGLIKNSWLPRIKNGKIVRNNKLDFFIAVEKSWEIVPSYVRTFYQGLSSNTLRAIEDRKREIAKSVIK